LSLRGTKQAYRVFTSSLILLKIYVTLY